MRFSWRAGACIVLVVLCIAWSLRKSHEIDPLPESQVLQTLALDSTSYKIADNGNIYRVDPHSGRWAYVEKAFEPEVIARSYARDGETIFRCDPDQPSTRFPVLRHFSDGFEDVPEGAAGLRRLIGKERMWSELTLQSPKAPQVSDYVDLRRKISAAKPTFWTPVSRHRANGSILASWL